MNFEFDFMFNSIKDILPKTVSRSGIGRQLQAAQVIRLFDEIKDQILPGHISNKVKAVYAKNKVLYVASLSSIVTQELKFRETEIIDTINGKLGKKIVEKIRYLA